MKDLEVDGENEKIEDSTTPTDVNVSFKTVIYYIVPYSYFVAVQIKFE